MLERAIDMFAAEVSLDPAEVRRRNFIAKDAFPYQTAAGAHYDCGDYATALDRVLERADYGALREEQEARRRSGDAKQLGIGLSTYVEITNGINETEFGAVEITADGTAIVLSGSQSQGQGHETTFAQIAAERLGLPLEKISVIEGDTDAVARGTGTYGSKSTQIGGRRRGRGLRGRRRARQAARRRRARGEPGGHGARPRRGAVPRRRRAGARADLGGAGGPARAARRARRAARRGRLHRPAADVPVRRAPGGRRGRHGDRCGDA